MASVYLETSFISACVSNRTDPKSAGWRVSGNDWLDTQAIKHDLFVSDEVVFELSSPDFPNRDAALRLVRGLTLLSVTTPVNDLAALLVQRRVMPGPANHGDAIHVAAAIYHRIAFMLTWNIKHLANPNKRTHLGTLCGELGLAAPQIVTPDLLREDDDE